MYKARCYIPVMYSKASHGTVLSSQNIFIVFNAHSRSLSLNSYGMFHPKGPNFFLSWITAWKKHIPKIIFLQFDPRAENQIILIYNNKESPIDPEIQKPIIPREKSSRCPKIYGLPKIHKPEVPLRPLVSSIGSPTQALARYLVTQLQPYVEQAKSYVRNSSHFIELIKKQQLDKDDMMVSFDVVSLFPQVPVGEALTIIQTKYKFILLGGN